MSGHQGKSKATLNSPGMINATSMSALRKEAMHTTLLPIWGAAYVDTCVTFGDLLLCCRTKWGLARSFSSLNSSPSAPAQQLELYKTSARQHVTS